MRPGGVNEVAAALGVSRQRVSKLRERPDFPDPVAELAQGTVWDLDEVEAWNSSGLRRSSGGRPTADAASRTFGDRFVLEERIGRGGFSVVWRAADRKRPGEAAAVKFLHEIASADPEAIRRFRRELRLLEDLEHPNVIPVLAHGETEDGSIWYAMPLAQGSLVDFIDEMAGKLPLVLDAMQQICAGLSHVHAEGIWHRDLKPGNILRTEDGTWAISDFGLAVEVERQTTALTSTLHAGLGSFWYTAPEQWKSARDADGRSDVYSLGKILQELVTGEAPVSADMPAGRLRPVVERATATQPADRYQSVSNLLSAVRAAVNTPDGTWEKADDVARRLSDRLRGTEPGIEALDDLLSWAAALDERNDEEMRALAGVLPALSPRAIRRLWTRDRNGFRRIFEHHCDHVAHAGFGFDYCDSLAEFARRVVETTKDARLLRAATYSLAEMGENHNRWHVRDVLTSLLQLIRDDEMAVAAAEGLNAARATAIEWSVTNFAYRSLHPTLRAAIRRQVDDSEAG